MFFESRSLWTTVLESAYNSQMINDVLAHGECRETGESFTEYVTLDIELRNNDMSKVRMKTNVR